MGRKMKETINVEGVDTPVPHSAEEEINDAIHEILRENYGMSPDVVYWEETSD